ncbi:hypothetical protein LCGC14_2293440, partial [marine sediment metagenome]
DYDRIIDNADEAIFRVEAEGGHMVYANPAAERLFGYSRAEWLADPALGFKIVHPDYAQTQRQIIEEINTTKKPVKNVTLGWIAKDGREVIAEYTIIPVLDEEGNILYFESIGRDITERKRAEQMLVEEKRLGELLLDSLPHPAMLIRRDRIILAANRTAREVGAIVGGVCWQEFAHADYIPEQHKRYVRDHGCAPPDGSHCTFCFADEALDCQAFTNNPQVYAFDRHWDTRWVPLDDEVYLHYSIDITERIETEEELHRSRERLAEAEKLASVGRVTARIAHEINNPLEIIYNYLKYLKFNTSDNDLRETVDDLHEEIASISNIVSNLITFSDSKKSGNEDIELNELIEKMVKMVKFNAQKKNIKINFSSAKETIRMRANKNEIKQVILNLMKNSFDASQKEYILDFCPLPKRLHRVPRISTRVLKCRRRP